MSRKSTKTAHVLTLISGASKGSPELPKNEPDKEHLSDLIQSRLTDEYMTTPASDDTLVSGQPAAAAQPPSFTLVNIMEVLVRRMLPAYFEKFHCCSCPKCTEDAVALALNELPPRYAVWPVSEQPARLAPYERKYMPLITVACTKACLAVRSSPRHTLDAAEEQNI